MPLFSIIIPFHNSADTLAATLDGVLAQTCADWELICVDDRSSDRSADIVLGFAAGDARIRLLTNDGQGPSDARNFGAAEAQGDILAFCDADDIWCPTKLAEIADMLADPSVAGAYGQIGFFKNVTGDSPTRSTVPAGALTIDALLAENPVCTLSNLAVRKNAFVRTGGFDSGLVHNEDLDFLIRLVGEGHILRGIDRLQVWYRTTPNGLSSDLDAMRLGRNHALVTAARYGVIASPAAEAVYMRYLARRALRLDAPKGEALRYTLSGLAQNAGSFLFPLRRGLTIAAASAIALGLPQPMRRALFSR